jgi:hypothetical protein
MSSDLPPPGAMVEIDFGGVALFSLPCDWFTGPGTGRRSVTHLVASSMRRVAAALFLMFSLGNNSMFLAWFLIC